MRAMRSAWFWGPLVGAFVSHFDQRVWKIGSGSRLYVHLPHELLLRLWAEVAVDSGLDFEEVLDDVLEAIWRMI